MYVGYQTMYKDAAEARLLLYRYRTVLPLFTINCSLVRLVKFSCNAYLSVVGLYLADVTGTRKAITAVFNSRIPL